MNIAEHIKYKYHHHVIPNPEGSHTHVCILHDDPRGDGLVCSLRDYTHKHYLPDPPDGEWAGYEFDLMDLHYHSKECGAEDNEHDKGFERMVQ